MRGILQDFRFTFRVLARDRWLAATAVTALALGIAVNAVGFSIVNGAFLRPLPFDDPDRLFVLTWQNRSGRRTMLSYEDLERWRGESRAFPDLAAFVDEEMNLSDDRGGPEEVAGTWTTVNGFRVLRQQPVIGRDFANADGRPGAELVVLISRGLWQRRFAGAPEVLGTAIRVNGRPATIAGVVAYGPGSPEGTDLWAPLATPDSEAARGRRQLHVMGRLRDGVSVRTAQAEMNAIASRMAAEGGAATSALLRARVETMTERFVGGVAVPVFLALMGAATFVLLIVCANVANLLLSRSVTRAREAAMRMALGATRWRVMRQLLVESVTLSAIGAGLGLPMAWMATPFLDAAIAGRGAPFWIHFTVDGAVAGYVALVCLATAVIFGLAPALQVSRANSHELIKEGGRGGAGSRRARWFGGAMVAAEVALTLVLLIGAGLMLRSFLNQQVIDMGFDTRPLLATRVRLLESRYATPELRRAFFARLEPRLAAIPGIEAAALTTGVPPFDGGERLVETARGDGAAATPAFASTVTITPPFFDALGVAMRRGRAFDDRDGAPGSEHVIVNERFVAQFLGAGDPLGRQIRFTVRDPQPGQSPQIWRTVVGVSPPIPHGSPQDGFDSAVVYLPYRQEAAAAPTLLLRTTLPAAAVAESVRQAVQAIDPDQPVQPARTIEDLLDETRWATRVFGGLFGIFAAIAMLLSAVGLYAVTAYSVTQRTAEIGVRMAIGAAARDVQWLVLRRGLAQVAAGLAIGLGGALALSRVLQRALVGVSPADPLTFAAIAALLVIVSMAACLVPARRATRIDPLAALRG